MPGFIAVKLCPELIFVPTDFKKYTHYSDLTRKGEVIYSYDFLLDALLLAFDELYLIILFPEVVFQKYDPCFIAASLDEAYLDITKACKERNITGGEVSWTYVVCVYSKLVTKLWRYLFMDFGCKLNLKDCYLVCGIF